MTQDKWQPIETAPKDGTRILLKNCNIVYDVFWSKYENTKLEGWCRTEDNNLYINSKFDQGWMPLPEPPTEEIKEKLC